MLFRACITGHEPQTVCHFHWVKVRVGFAFFFFLPHLPFDTIRLVLFINTALLSLSANCYINIWKAATHNSPVELIYVKKLFSSAQLETCESICTNGPLGPLESELWSFISLSCCARSCFAFVIISFGLIRGSGQEAF